MAGLWRKKKEDSFLVSHVRHKAQTIRMKFSRVPWHGRHKEDKNKQEDKDFICPDGHKVQLLFLMCHEVHKVQRKKNKGSFQFLHRSQRTSATKQALQKKDSFLICHGGHQVRYKEKRENLYFLMRHALKLFPHLS
jgi:hypothetical protein